MRPCGGVYWAHCSTLRTHTHTEHKRYKSDWRHVDDTVEFIVMTLRFSNCSVQLLYT